MYVAITRARRWLVLSFVDERRKRAQPSPFLRELLAGLQPDQIRWNDDETRRRVVGGSRSPVAAKGAGAASGRGAATPARVRKLGGDGAKPRGKRAGRV
jgi:DNA helicase-2/ATP-dependent DNA helicase PcrA